MASDGLGSAPEGREGRYSATCVTMPAPTVRPPSRIAKRTPGSRPTGLINRKSTVVRPPGVTRPCSPTSSTPVTDVVPK